MLKKAKAQAEQEAKSHGQAKDLADTVMQSSRQIWLAGLGAFARAQAEGSKVFEALVQQGQALESRTRTAAGETAAAARDAAQAKAKEMQSRAGGAWDKLEQVFEDRVARALSRLGVHTQKDVERLAERVDALSEAVNELIKARGGAAPQPRKPARKAARSANAPAAQGGVERAAPTKRAASKRRKSASSD